MFNFGKFDFRVSISHSIILIRTASSNRGVGSPHGLSPMKDAISRVSAAECLEALLELQRSLPPLPILAPFLNSLEAKLDSIPHACWVGGCLLPIDTRTPHVYVRRACIYGSPCAWHKFTQGITLDDQDAVRGLHCKPFSGGLVQRLSNQGFPMCMRAACVHLREQASTSACMWNDIQLIPHWLPSRGFVLPRTRRVGTKRTTPPCSEALKLAIDRWAPPPGTRPVSKA